MRWPLFLTLWASLAAAQVTFIGSNIGRTASVTVPAGTQAGDLLLVAVTNDNGQLGSFAWPAGFVQLHSAAVESPDGQSWAVGYAFATGLEATIDVANRNGIPMVAVAVYRGVDPFFPIAGEVEDHSIQHGGTYGPWALQSAGLSVSSANDVVVWIAGIDLKLGINVPGYDGGVMTPTTYTPPPGFVLRQQDSYLYTSLAIAEFRPTGAGPLGPFSGQASLGYVDIGNTVSFVVALRASASSVVTPSITFVGESSTLCTGGVDTLFAPPGIQAGDVLIASATFEGAATTLVTWPPGFSEFTLVGDLMPVTTALASSVATGGEGALTFQVATPVGCLFTLLAYRGASGPGGPLGTSTGPAGVSPWSFQAPGISSVPAGALLVEGQVLSTSAPNMSKFSPPAGFSERHDESVDHFGVAFSDFLAPGGVPGVSAGSATDSDGLMGQATTILFTLLPARVDAGVDGGAPDAGVDAGAPDAGTSDAGLVDAGIADAGLGEVDAGLATDAGTGAHRLAVGCGCSSNEALLALGAVLLSRRRRGPEKS
jgi:hypothetical protein